MPAWYQLNILSWQCILGEDYKVYVLNDIREDPGYILNYLSESELPQGYFSIESLRIRSDIIRLALLNKYGGIWIDGSTVLLRSLDEFCFKEFKDRNIILCGVYLQDYIKKFSDYDFQGKDFFESAFVATKTNNPLIEKWSFILNRYWDNRRVSTNIFEHEIFKNAPKANEFNNKDGNYFTIHYSLRRLIGGDQLARKLYLDHTYKVDVMEKGGYYILQEIGVVHDWSDVKVQEFTDFLTKPEKFN